MKKTINTFLKAILAGFIVSFASCIYINNKNIIGCLFFSVALIVILKLDLKLFTGMAGFNKDYKYLVVALLGNILAVISSFVFFKQKIKDEEVLKAIVKCKLEQNFLVVFFSSIVCGILIYTAVLSYKKNSDTISVIFCVAGFVLFGADHCIANTFFFISNNNINFMSILNITICIIGNYIGAFVCHCFQKEGVFVKP